MSIYYIYAFGRHFYSKDLQCVIWFESTTCAANSTELHIHEFKYFLFCFLFISSLLKCTSLIDTILSHTNTHTCQVPVQTSDDVVCRPGGRPFFSSGWMCFYWRLFQGWQATSAEVSGLSSSSLQTDRNPREIWTWHLQNSMKTSLLGKYELRH